MTLLVVDPPVCFMCPLFHGELDGCSGADRRVTEDESLAGSPDWCPLRKGDVVVRFKDGGAK